MADDFSNTVSTTGLVSVGGAASGALETAGDSDWFKVTLTAGQTYQFFLIGSQFGGTQVNTLADPFFRILDGAGQALAFDNDGYGFNSLLTFTAPTTGIYFLEASSASPSGVGTYQLSVKPTAAIPELADYLVNGWYDYIATSGAGSATTPRQWGSNTISVNISDLTALEQSLALTTLQLYDDAANLSFVVTTGVADLTYTNNGSGAASTDWTVSGDFITSAIVNISSDLSPSAAVNTHMFQAFLHETGHALGLGHSGPYNGGSPAYGFDNLYANDTLQSTVMTYFGWPGQALHDHVITPQMADIYAVQSMYGASNATRLGPTTYGFNSSAGSFFNFSTYGPLIAFTIVDSGGADTLDASGYSMNQRINLTPGSWSSIGGAVNNIAIYLTTQIETAIGGSGADQLVGNSLNNTLKGNAGNDTLLGAAGADVLSGGTGADAMRGGSGNDTYVVDNAGDTTTETSASGGVDLVKSSVTRTLGANFENLTLTGPGNINGVGNAMANTITGNSGSNTLSGGSGADTLSGGLGLDTLIGGGGIDKFVFNTAPATANRDAITDYNVAADTIQLDNAAFAALGAAGALAAGKFHIGASAHDANDRIVYNSANGALYYDSNGNAAGGAVQIATLTPGLLLTAADFVVI